MQIELLVFRKLSCENVAWKAFYPTAQGNTLGFVYERGTLWKSKSRYVQQFIIAFAPSGRNPQL